jgi:hypothetical protein
VRIPEQLQPLDRGAKYEDPLDAVLKKERVGEVSGGGTQLSAPDADGKKSIEWVGVDVDLTDFDKACRYSSASYSGWVRLPVRFWSTNETAKKWKRSCDDG